MLTRKASRAVFLADAPLPPCHCRLSRCRLLSRRLRRCHGGWSRCSGGLGARGAQPSALTSGSAIRVLRCGDVELRRRGVRVTASRVEADTPLVLLWRRWTGRPGEIVAEHWTVNVERQNSSAVAPSTDPGWIPLRATLVRIATGSIIGCRGRRLAPARCAGRRRVHPCFRDVDGAHAGRWRIWRSDRSRRGPRLAFPVGAKCAAAHGAHDRRETARPAWKVAAQPLPAMSHGGSRAQR